MAVEPIPDAGHTILKRSPNSESGVVIVRIFGWVTLTFLAVFLVNNYLTFWLGWPGSLSSNVGDFDARSIVQIGLYVAAFAFVVFYVFRDRQRSLRSESRQISCFNSFLMRAAFYAVLLIGLIDASLSFLRSEDLLDGLVGKEFARTLMSAEVRGIFVHMPLIALSIVIAVITRTIGVIWLALLIVVAELLIVMLRFVFSYEQVYMTDLVRFWYAALFLIGCAYTMREDGHVRVDVFYAKFSPKAKGLVNAIGTLLLGMPFCWLILLIGTNGKTGIINSALLSFEIQGLGDGMYILYLMTVFMGIFAISMLIQLVSFLFDAVADYLEEPGSRSDDASRVR